MEKEEKRISEFELMTLIDEEEKKRNNKRIVSFSPEEAIKRRFRDWLLGGETFNWIIYKEIGSGDIVLRRF